MNINWTRILKMVQRTIVRIRRNWEKIKTVTLTLLIMLSLVLTWSLWTFKPNYGVLESTRVVKKEIVADRKRATDVLSPSQIVYHDGKQLYGIVGHSLLDVVSSRLENSKFYYQKQNLINFEPEDSKKPFIEVVYPVSMPSDVYSQLLHLDDPGVNRLTGVDRIIFYPNDASVYLASYSERKMMKVGSTFPYKEIQELMKQAIKSKSAVPFMTFDEKEEPDVGETIVTRRFYLPKDKVQVKSYKYLAQSVSDNVYDKYKSALFPDPQSVKSGATQNGQTFTDVSSALVINENVNRMKFTNFAGSGSTLQNTNPLISSIDYINTHAGWGNTYFLSDLNSYRAVFYPEVRNMPILNSDMEMSLTWDENELYEYQRSLIELNDEGLPFNDHPDAHTLESGETVAEELRTSYAPQSVHDVRIGFWMKPESDSQVYHLEPKWFILYGDNKRWQPLFKEKGEF
ncbi:YycH family regulatory protein [Fictibacillus iocasae]|uniref:YycH family regulatory protein n=1 Tax=Fictibacillus iocasae TaxID=2715437 RepID=A0ABW2NMC4_9BACL